MGTQKTRQSLDLPAACHLISGWPKVTKVRNQLDLVLYIFFLALYPVSSIAVASPSTLQARILNCILRSHGFP